MLDLQKLTIRRLLETQDSDLYSRISPKFFSGNNLLLYHKIEHFYKTNLRVPNLDEFVLLKKELSLQEYYETQILDSHNKNDNVQNEFLLSQLQDHCVRDDTISFVDDLLDELEGLESTEIMDKFQNHLLELNKAVPIGQELIDVAALDTIPSKENFILYNSGLSAEYDAENGGFALQELVMLGGMRGSGKSILALNVTANRFLKENHTVGFFSIEMRYQEVYWRLMSIITEIPFLKFMTNNLSPDEKVLAGKRRMEVFYEKSDLVDDAIAELEKTKDIDKFDLVIRTNKPKMKDNRFFIIDEPDLTPNRIDHYCNIFKNKYKDFTMGTVDYINIINVENSKDWQSQISVAESLKMISRKYDITVVSPYQIDNTLEARYAKGILDSADRAFSFAPKKAGDEDMDRITMFTSKIRNGKNMTFDVGMNWSCVKVDPKIITSDLTANTKLLPGTQFGRGTEEGSKDL